MDFTPFECQDGDSALYVTKQCNGLFCFNVDELTGDVFDNNFAMCVLRVPEIRPSLEEIVEKDVLGTEEPMIYEGMRAEGLVIVDLEHFKYTSYKNNSINKHLYGICYAFNKPLINK